MSWTETLKAYDEARQERRAAVGQLRAVDWVLGCAAREVVRALATAEDPAPMLAELRALGSLKPPAAGTSFDDLLARLDAIPAPALDSSQAVH
jgi:hypothetical protein